MTIAAAARQLLRKDVGVQQHDAVWDSYSLTTLHTEAVDSPEFKADLEWFSAVCRVVKGFKNLRIGAIGARPDGVQYGSLLARGFWRPMGSRSRRSTCPKSSAASRA